MDIKIEKISAADINNIKDLQPIGWSDITIEFEQYIKQDFCNPIKVIVNEKVVGIGNSIVFTNTAWIAHIIVKEEYRNRGIGYQMVNFLIAELKSKQIETVLLIATELGEPVYKKAGFKTISDYLFLKREKTQDNKPLISSKVINFSNDFYDEIIQLDKAILGENRERLIKLHIEKSLVYKEENTIQGFYLPDLGEGLILANTSEAGIELMKLKHAKIDTAVIPSENKAGLDFLMQNGFKLQDTKGRKMILGKEIVWKPDCYFSRIGGNYG
jgi:N-acetylglutamate synthase-like GNAT family acetyltransferase